MQGGVIPLAGLGFVKGDAFELESTLKAEHTTGMADSSRTKAA